MKASGLFIIGGLLLGETWAHTGCGGHEIGRRNPGGRTIAARQAAPTDEASGEQSIDPAYECTGYGYAPVTNIIKSYPAIWNTAYIMPGDTAASSLFSTINATLNSKFGTDGPRGTNNGNEAGVNYNSSDPDCWWTWRQCDTPAASTGLKPDITTVPEPMTWGLGFDDGPNCSHNALYDYLRANDQKATMFYIGSNVMDWPLQALRGIADGHQICVHTWSHQYMTSFSNENAFAELYYARKAIQDVLGVTPLCWRPPFGDVDNRIRAIAAGLNMSTIVWSDDTEDWREGVPAQNVTPQDVANNYQAVVSKAKNGTYNDHGPVVLNHELTNFTMSEFIQQYPSIKSAFKHVVPLCTAMNWTHPYAETNITCPDFATYTSGSIFTGTNTTQVDGGNGGSASQSSATGSSVSGGNAGHAATGVASASASSGSAAKSGAGRAICDSGVVSSLLVLLAILIANP